MAFNNVYQGKKVLITGNTGFKGSWLSTWLTMLGAEVYGYSIDVPSEPGMFNVCKLNDKIHHKFGDIRDKEAMNAYVQEVKPDFIFHLAAQALVLTSYKDPFDTMTTNVIGTTSVLEAIRNIDWNCTCVLITSDKAYNNVEWIWGYRETDEVGGKDVYSGSKGAAELAIRCYWYSFIQNMPNIKMGVARAGNVIGGGDWAKDRIIVDCVKAFSKGETVEIRCPKATRPWQDLAEEWGVDKEKASKLTGNVPFKEATLLKLNCDKALAYLNWHSTLHYEQCVHIIAEWYKAFYEGKNVDMFDLTKKQIEYYTKEAESQNLNWTK